MNAGFLQVNKIVQRGTQMKRKLQRQVLYLCSRRFQTASKRSSCIFFPLEEKGLLKFLFAQRGMVMRAKRYLIMMVGIAGGAAVLLGVMALPAMAVEQTLRIG